MNLPRRHSSLRPLWSAFIVFCIVFISVTGNAQVRVDQVLVEDLSKLVDTLENDAERERFLTNLKALLAAQESASTASPVQDEAGLLLSVVGEKVATLGSQFAALAEVFGDPRQTAGWFIAQAESPELREFWTVLAIHFVVILAAGFLAAWIARSLLIVPRRSLEEREPPPLGVRIPLLLARTLLDLLPVVAFALVAFIAVAVLDPGAKARVVLLAVVEAMVLAKGIVVALRMLFTPLAPSLRLFDVSDQTAAYTFVWLRRLVSVPVYGYFLLQAALALGLPESSYAGILKLVGLLEAILLVVLAMQLRESVAAAIRPVDISGSTTARAFGGLCRRIGEIWHILGVLYVGCAYVIWALEISGGFAFISKATAITIVIIVAARFARTIISRLVQRAFRVTGELQARYPQVEERANRYLPLFTQLLTAVVYLFAGVMILQAWQIDIVVWLLSESGREIVARVFSIALVLMVALVVWEIVTLLISIYLERADSDDSAITASARVRTLLPLARNALLIVILAIVILTILAELGVNIGPLLAGAGVAGLAIGFGAQTLVKDVITGAFILFEDQIAVGDVASVGGYTGVVEGLTVRTISLRDLHGRVHVVPFSAVSDVTNFTKDYSNAVIDAGVAYRENTDEVTQLLLEVGEEMRSDPDFKDDLPLPLEVLGVQELGDSAVVVRVRFRTTAGRQWAVSREFNRRMKMKFDEHGVEIPFPHQTVYFGEDKQGRAPPVRVAMGVDGANEKADRKVVETPRQHASNAPDDAED